MTRVLMEGSEAIAEAMVAAGCRFFAGYPMTPFTEVLEHMARKLPAAQGGVCMNAEDLHASGGAKCQAVLGEKHHARVRCGTRITRSSRSQSS